MLSSWKWKKESRKARKEVKELRQATEKATPFADFVKIVQDPFTNNAKIKKDQQKVAKYKQYVPKYAIAKAALKDILQKLRALW